MTSTIGHPQFSLLEPSTSLAPPEQCTTLWEKVAVPEWLFASGWRGHRSPGLLLPRQHIAGKSGYGEAQTWNNKC